MEAKRFMLRAIELARVSESEGNLPVGAVITHEGEIVAEGQNAIWAPDFDATRHAEMEALRVVPAELWNSSKQLALFTTLEPCLMCFGSILLHRIGEVHYGSADSYGGASTAFAHLPPYFERRLENTRWLGPLMPAECDPLNDRVMMLVTARRQQT